MSKWKCEICNSEFENFHAQGFNHEIYCPLCYFKKLYNDTELEREKLQTQLQQKENIIKEVIEKIKEFCWDYEYETYSNMTSDEVKELFEILDKEEK